MIGLIGKKLGMTRTFQEDGRSVPVTVIQAGPCVITQVKNMDTDGYTAVQMGFGAKKAKNTPMPMQGHFRKAGTDPLRTVAEFTMDEGHEYNLGDTINLSVLSEIELVDVTGTTKGRGFSGTIKRHGHHRGPDGHGSKNVRGSGSIGMHTFPGRVLPGKDMPGQGQCPRAQERHRFYPAQPVVPRTGSERGKTMATAKLYSGAGEAKGTVDLPASLFEQPVHKQALYEAVRNYLANQRQGTHDTKTRAEVKASNAKLYRQKGTGRARAGSAGSPTRIGGGVAFGPHPRDYSYTLPRKVKRKALVSALSDRAESDRINVIEDFEMEAPKTRTVAGMLQAMELEGRHTLLVLPTEGDAVYKSARNIKGVRVLRSNELNAYTILWADNLVFTQKALDGAEEVFGS